MALSLGTSPKDHSLRSGAVKPSTGQFNAQRKGTLGTQVKERNLLVKVLVISVKEMLFLSFLPRSGILIELKEGRGRAFFPNYPGGPGAI